MKFTRMAAAGSVSFVLACSQPRELTPDNAFEKHISLATADEPSIISFSKVKRVCPYAREGSECASVGGERPVNAFVTSTGHIVFFDRHNGLIEVDSTGAFIREIGELGKDPGAYIRVSALAGNAERTTIWDGWLGRATIYPERQSPVPFRVRADGLTDVQVANDYVFALTFPAGTQAGDRVIGAISDVNEKGLLRNQIAAVAGLAFRRAKSDMVEIPSFYWPRAIWTVFGDGEIAYLTPDTALRIEMWDPRGKPKLLVTGHPPIPDAPISAADILAREVAFYKALLHPEDPDLGADRARCAQIPLSRQPKEIAIRCMTIAWIERIGRRSPRIRPSVEDVVGVSPHELWLRTSAATADSVTWLVTGQGNHRLALAKLSRDERPLGRLGNRIAIADTARGRVTVTLRSYETN